MHVAQGAGSVSEATQLREGLLTGTLTGTKINYLDSGYSEEGDVDQQVTSCLMKTSSGSIYIPPSKYFTAVCLHMQLFIYKLALRTLKLFH